ncbi:MAG TPA: arginase family protein, partial [Limnochordia bacterium]
MSGQDLLGVPRAATGRFLASRDAHAIGEGGCKAAILGAGLDQTVSLRPGTRFAPARVRELSEGLETYSPLLSRDLADLAFTDYGDVELPFGDLFTSLARIEQAVASVLGAGMFPCLIGGEHLITLPAVRAARRSYPDLVVVQIDAHADLRETYMDVSLSHATVMLRIAELV